MPKITIKLNCMLLATYPIERIAFIYELHNYYMTENYGPNE